jgi:hypothetical protein
MPFPFEGSATIGTAEYSLPAATTTGVPTAQTDDGAMQSWIDFSALTAAADVFEVKVYEKATASATQRTILTIRVDTPRVVVLPAFKVAHGWDVTVKKISGTDRAIVWSLRS